MHRVADFEAPLALSAAEAVALFVNSVVTKEKNSNYI